MRGKVITYEECFNEAKKYKYYTDFRIQSNSKYCKAIKMKWVNDYTWLKKNYRDTQSPINLIYVYEFIETKAAYIGRTMRFKTRCRQHKTDKKDSVYKYAKENCINIQDYIPKILDENLNSHDSQIMEAKWIDIYKANKWNIINKVKAGSLGGNIVKYTHEYCKNEAMKYDNITDFRKSNINLYEKCKALSWIKDFTWLKPYTPSYNFTYEECFNEAKKYKTITDFYKHSFKFANYSRKHNLLKTFHWLNKKQKTLVAYDLNGYFIEEYTHSQNSKNYGFFACARGKRKFSHNRIWKYKDDVLDKEGNILLKIQGIKNKYESISKPIIQYNKNGQYIHTFKSIKEAAKTIGISSTTIIDSIKKRNGCKCAGGFIWKYLEK